MIWYLYILFPLAIIGVIVALVLLLRTKVDFAKQISDTSASIYEQFVSWLKRVTFFNLRQSMRLGVKAIKSTSETNNYRYEKPWYLLLGSESSGKTTLLESFISNSDLQDNKNVNWGIFKNGTILDVSSEYFLPTDEGELSRFSRYRGWKKVLRQLQIHREKRPLDGIILTLDVSKLQQASPSNEVFLQEVASIRKRLSMINERTGMKAPVYLLVTKCDILPNFIDFAKSFSENHNGSILGWSSPYNTDVVYEEFWAEEAIAAVLNSISQVTPSLLKQTNNSNIKDNVYDVYRSLHSLSEPLSIWLNTLFQSPQNKKDILLRGIYFTGHEKIVEEEKESSNETVFYGMSPFETNNNVDDGMVSAPKQKGYFVNELLPSKIFPEYSLSIPIKSHFVKRNKLSLVLHILFFTLLLTCTVLIAISWKDLLVKSKELTKMAEDLRDERQTSRFQLEKIRKPYFYADQTKKYLSNFADLERNKLFNYAIPASWLGWFHRDFRKCIAFSLKDVVITGMKEEFERKAQYITDDSKSYNPRDTISLNRYSLNSTPEYIALQNFVTASSEFEHNVTLYNKLASPHSDQRLSKIIYYLYGSNIEADVTQLIESDYQLMKSVEDIDRLNLESQRPFFQKKSTLLNNDLLKKLFGSNPIVSSITNFQTSYSSAVSSADDKEVYDSFFGMAQNLDILDRALKNKETQWISSDGFVFDANGRKLLEIIGSSTLLGSDVKTSIERGFDTTFIQMRSNIQGKTIQMRNGINDSSYIVIVSPDSKRFVMSESIDNTFKALSDWKKQSFIFKSNHVSRLNQVAQTFGENQRIVWNSSLLKTIPTTLENYTKYLAEGINKFPSELQLPAENVVRNGIQVMVSDIVTRSAGIEPSTSRRGEQEIAVEVQSLLEASPHLALSLRQLGNSNDGSGSSLASLLGKQISGIMYSVDGWVNDRSLYSAQITDQRLLNWKSDKALLSLGFDIDNSEDLTDYLEKQRKPFEGWCKEIATPLISFYNSNGLNSTARVSQNNESIIRRWQFIVKAIEGYAAKAPNNSLIKLEDFVSGLGHIYVQNIEDIQKVALTRSGINKEDLFLGKIREISDEIRKGISLHSAPRFREDYKKLYKTTNDVLQLFPFGQSEIDAEPEKVKSYFNSINNEVNFARLLVSAGGEIPLGHSEFLKEVTAAKEFFKPIIYAGENNSGSYNVTLTFRTNTQKEQNASVVFGRVVSQTPSGAQFDKNLFTPGESTTFQWRPGDDFKFELRWAKDGTVSPVAGSDKYTLINDKTVAFKSSGVWSLFRFMANNQNGKKNGKLQLALRVITNATPSGASNDTSTILFVDIDITPKYKDEVLAFPLFGIPPTPE